MGTRFRTLLAPVGVSTGDGRRVPLDQPFTVGGAPLQFPGDPLGPASLVINCRCSMALVGADEQLDMTNRQMRR